MTGLERYALALGFFDGVHLGHQALLRRTVLRAGQRGMVPAVFTFDRSPREAVTGEPVPLLTDLPEREALIRSLYPIRRVIAAPFDRELMEMPWDEFVEKLRSHFRAGYLVAGHDFRFGAGNAGTPELLREKARALGMGCDIVPAVSADGQVISSTAIRSMLERGEAERAERALGRPYRLSGPVSSGRGLGSKLGAPTLNLLPPAGRLLPALGVYAASVTALGRVYPAAVNVGVRPTVEEDGAVVVESRLLERCPERPSYISVDFLRFLRPERRFPSLDALGAQIASDAEAARDCFDRRTRKARKEREG